MMSSSASPPSGLPKRPKALTAAGGGGLFGFGLCFPERGLSHSELSCAVLLGAESYGPVPVWAGRTDHCAFLGQRRRICLGTVAGSPGHWSM